MASKGPAVTERRRESDYDDLVLATAQACWWIARRIEKGTALRLIR